MALILAASMVVCAALAVALISIFRELLSRHRTGPITPEWVSGFSTARYQPMERLLAEDDYIFLAHHPGASRAVIRRLRAQRRVVFRGYLRTLQRDFRRITNAIQFLMVQSEHDRPELAAVLVKQRVLFALGMTTLQFRLLLHSCGLATVDGYRLVQLVESMRIQMRQLVPVVQPGVAWEPGT